MLASSHVDFQLDLGVHGRKLRLKKDHSNWWNGLGKHAWVFSETVKDLLFNWWNGLGKHASDIWNLVPLCLMWIVWLERNRRSFEDTSTADSQLRDSFAVMLFDWSRVWNFTSSPNVFDFISCLSHSS